MFKNVQKNDEIQGSTYNDRRHVTLETETQHGENAEHGLPICDYHRVLLVGTVVTGVVVLDDYTYNTVGLTNFNTACLSGEVKLARRQRGEKSGSPREHGRKLAHRAVWSQRDGSAVVFSHFFLLFFYNPYVNRARWQRGGKFRLSALLRQAVIVCYIGWVKDWINLIYLRTGYPFGAFFRIREIIFISLIFLSDSYYSTRFVIPYLGKHHVAKN